MSLTSREENLNFSHAGGDNPQISTQQTNISGNVNLPHPTICAARIAKLPPFWREEPELWFLQVDSNFNLNGITQDSTKYEYLLSHLDQSVLFVVKDIIMNPPSENKYLIIKSRIIQHFAESGEGQLKKLLNGLELGDQKPSHLLQRMKCLAGSSVSNDMLKTLFMERLPEKTKCILAVAESTDLDKIASLADKICEQYSPNLIHVSEVLQVSDKSQDSNVLSQKLDTIIARIESLERRPRQRSRNRSSELSNSKGRKNFSMCWYHWKFAENATKCIKPCNFSNSKN